MKIRIIGQIIKQLREEQKMSIVELAERSGVECAKLEAIETGGAIPAVGVMIKISRALGARLGTLLDGGENMGAVVTRADQSKPNRDFLKGGEVGANPHQAFFSLGEGKTDRAMEPMIVSLGMATDSTLSEHEGEEFIYVLSGIVEVHYGKQVHTLKKGDTIYYNSIVPHSVYSATQDGAEILAVIYTPY